MFSTDRCDFRFGNKLAGIHTQISLWSMEEGVGW